MNSRQFLIVIAIAQGVLFVALVVLIMLNRWLRLRRRAHLHPRKIELDAAMQRWTIGKAEVGAVLLRLGRLPVPLAVDALVTWSARVPGDRWRRLAAELQHQWWTRLVRANYRSARWWRRLETARFLSVAAMPADAPRVLALLRDHHPAVHIAAVATLERLDNAALATAALERLPKLAPTVSAYYAAMLRRSRPVVVQLLLKLLRRTSDPTLPRIAEFAARLQEPALRECLTDLAGHADQEVRTQVARAMSAYPHPDSLRALERLAADRAWQVRAQAMRSLGMLGDRQALPILRAAATDPEWWVRFRAGLALTRFGPEGMRVLLDADVGPDTAARDMAHLILGLSSQALAEFAT